MTLFIKTMSSASVADENNSKPFSLFVVPEGVKVDFDRDSRGKPVMLVPEHREGSQSSYDLAGNSYVMDGNRTVATFAYSEHYSPAQMTQAEEFLRKSGWFNSLKRGGKEMFMWATCAFWSMPQDAHNPTRQRNVKLDIVVPQEMVSQIEETFRLGGFSITVYFEPVKPNDTSVTEPMVKISELEAVVIY